CEIAGLGDHRAGSGAKADAELFRHDLRQRGLAESGGADEQHVVQRLAALARRLDEHGEILARLLLADEFGEQLRPERGVADIVAAALGRNHPGGRVQAVRSLTIAGRAKASFAPWPPSLRFAPRLVGTLRFAHPTG